MRLVKATIACIVIAVVWTVTFLYNLLLKASGEGEKPVRVRTRGEWPYRWLW